MKTLFQIVSVLITMLLIQPIWAQQPPAAIQNTSSPCAKLNWDFTVNDTTGIVIWNTAGQYSIVTSIIIPSGQTLQIHGNTRLEFAYGCKIHVEIGGVLELGPGVELSSCSPNQFWEGIDVAGTLNQPQTSAYQGYVSLIGATISRARAGVEQVDNCAGESGGIVQADSTTFRNNYQSARFFEWSSTTYSNASYLKNCDFEITTAYDLLGNTQTFGNCTETIIGDQVTLEGNNDMEIWGCTFENNLNPASPLWSHSQAAPSAIWMLNSEPVFYDTSATCPNVIVTGNHFFGWYHGILAAFNTGGVQNVVIVGSNFENNRHGIYVSRSKNVVIVNNTFTVNDSLQHIYEHRNCNGLGDSKNTYGIYVREKTDNLRVIGNDFDMRITQSFSGLNGLAFSNPTGNTPSNVEIQGNNFQMDVGPGVTIVKVAAATGVVLINYTPSGNTTLECNTFNLDADPTTAFPSDYNYSDFNIQSPGTVTINYDPSNDYANNQWTPYGTCPAIGPNRDAFHIRATSTLNYTAGPGDTPSCIDANINVTTSTGTASCPTYNYCHVFGGAPSARVMQSHNETATPAPMHEHQIIMDLFPNPVDNELSLSTKANGIGKILGMDGGLIMENVYLREGLNTIDVSALPAGPYLLQITTGTTVTTGQFLKE